MFSSLGEREEEKIPNGPFSLFYIDAYSTT